jgi:hypothetical protein
MNYELANICYRWPFPWFAPSLPVLHWFVAIRKELGLSRYHNAG